MGGGTGPCVVAAACRLQAIFSVEAGTSPGIVLETAALRCFPRAFAVYCGDARTIARAVRVRMGERAIASIWHYKDKRKQTQKRSGLTTARASSQADRALRSAWKRGGWGRYFGLLYVTEWPLSAASSSDSDTACAIIRGPLVAVSYAKYFQVAG